MNGRTGLQPPVSCAYIPLSFVVIMVRLNKDDNFRGPEMGARLETCHVRHRVENDHCIAPKTIPYKGIM